MNPSLFKQLPAGFAFFHVDSNFIAQLHTFEKHFVELFNWFNAHFKWQTTDIETGTETTDWPCDEDQNDEPDDCKQYIHDDNLFGLLLNYKIKEYAMIKYLELVQKSDNEEKKTEAL